MGTRDSLSSGVSTSVTKSTSKKGWKSKLEEHLKDRKDISIKYITKENPKGGFTSKVYCPEIGYAEGEGSSKSAAENNAAYNALKKLEEAVY